ncbi:alpha-tectorin-like [Morone saxatilis]|uniref:alpha-tectorin-like n=1 Tax=Morone saxatilis TaxID=34816 RepID=UPI0015E1DAFD|nr:alpha-tectorin-like [Morone saxatilis]
MFCFVLLLAALILPTGTDATNQTFTSSGEMNITSCPITYYGQKYDKVYIEQVELGNFGTQAILAIKTYSGYTNVDVEADSQVNGLTVFKQKFHTNETKKGVITDVSGCRLSGFVYKTNTTVKDPNICSTVTCDVSGVATAVSDCGPMELCQGNGSCILNTMCTVTSSTVIDFLGRVHSVPDRCGYTLMRPSSIPDFQVLGVFQERRRKDVSFLDRVILQLGTEGVQIFLEQGGRVQLNDTVLNLNATAQVVHGVELSKDQTGVTAKISASNHTVSVLFDGYTTLIHMTGPSAASVQGLCGSYNRSVSEEQVSKYSASGCEMQYNDTADGTINCNTTTEWCNILKQPPFTACNINPEPFITACTRTLCKYPTVDGLKCQFLEAYARACSLQNNVTVENWRSNTNCREDAFCQDRFCSAHEFCGEKNYGGEPRCLCRAIFASKYRSMSTFGEPTVCGQTSASVSLANCLLEEQSINYSVLHLNDQACKGEMDNLTHMVTFTFDSSSNTCGAVVMVNKTHITYKNTIMTQNFSTFGFINRNAKVHMDFSCCYSQPDVSNLAIKLKHSAVIQQITSGEWNYNLTMKAYTDSERLEAIEPGTDIQLDETIWVELKTDGLDENLVLLVTDSCWATDQPSPNGTLRYNIIINGCPNPADQTVKAEGNGLRTSNYFAFNSFQFSGKTTDVYLHCRVELCVRQDNTCAPSCSQAERRRRSAMSKSEDENPAFITMVWTS